MTDRPTMPPGADDAQATRFAARLAELERKRPQTASGLFRALAEAHAETTRAK